MRLKVSIGTIQPTAAGIIQTFKKIVQLATEIFERTKRELLKVIVDAAIKYCRIFNIHSGIILLAPSDSDLDIRDPSSPPSRPSCRYVSWMYISLNHDVRCCIQELF
jgi:hypothetical protein